MFWCSLSFRCFLCQSLSLLSKSYCSFSWAKWDKTKTTFLSSGEWVICKILRFLAVNRGSVDSWKEVDSCYYGILQLPSYFFFKFTPSPNFTQKLNQTTAYIPDEGQNCSNSNFFLSQQNTSGIHTQENKHKRLDRMKRFFIVSFYDRRRRIRWKHPKEQRSGSV